MRSGETIECKVEKVVYGGRGLAHIHNMVMFIAHAVPGDKVLAQVIGVKRKFAEAEVLDLIEPSPYRITAPCPHHRYCGGCIWQCIDYAKQLEFKHNILMELLTHIGKVTDFAVHAPLASPRIYAYRNKMAFSFSEKGYVPPYTMGEKSDRRFALGFHVPGSFDTIVDIAGCLLQKEKGNEIFREAKRYMDESKIPAYSLKTGQGYWRSLILRHSYFFDTWLVNIVTGKEKRGPAREVASRLQGKFPELISIVNTVNTKRKGTRFGGQERVLVGEGNIKEKIGGLTFRISANSFFQTNTSMAERLYRVVHDFASLTGQETILDLYCGIGSTALLLAYQAKRIIGIDISRAVIADARKNCRLNGIDHGEFICGDVKTVLPQLNVQPDLVIIDPPRTGMQKAVVAQILKLLPDRIIYISCNPSTLARDISLLHENYSLEEIQVVDLFPHTYHIESVAGLRRI